MTNGVKTMKDLEAEEQAKLAELSGLETKLLELHEKEHILRTELQHIEIQKARIAGC